MSYLGICKASKIAEIPSATDKYLSLPERPLYTSFKN